MDADLVRFSEERGLDTKWADDVGNEAFRLARAEGCNCEPEVSLSPIAAEPWWHADVLHDDWCLLVARLRRGGAPITPASDG